MKIFIYLGLIFCMLASTGYAQDVGTITLAWDANTETDLAGYKIHRGIAEKTYSITVDVGKTLTPADPQHTLENIPREMLFFYAATAYDTSGNESDFSNEVEYTLAPLDKTSPKAPVIRIKWADGTVIIIKEP